MTIRVLLGVTLLPGASCGRGPGSSFVEIAVFDDFQSDQNPPYDDRLTILRYDLAANTFETRTQRSGFNAQATAYGGTSRSLTASPDGKHIAVAERGAGRVAVMARDLTDAPSPATVPSLLAAFLTDSRLYTTQGQATVDGDALRAFDLDGAELPVSPSASLAGRDVVIDEGRNVAWTAGKDLRRGDATALAGVPVASFNPRAVSIDLARDGSVWVAEWLNVGSAADPGPSGGLRHFDATGAELAADTRSWGSWVVSQRPTCVRVHPQSGDVWVAHEAGILRVNAAGVVSDVESSGKWGALSVDPVNGLVFAAGGSGNDAVKVFRKDGTPLQARA